ncbi:KPN_02809 family neutral zinc metallopeptidase [Oceanobacillus rekensis]|uniref:KPN_02809 family neutral zinc metallopeptidase n=1 Tax=Oceanobacillus rekensis TaxID=937927 RepID=UPI000B43D640|nr:neutral zinc metallopeptidase [Oceanobacillus rekensis]
MKWRGRKQSSNVEDRRGKSSGRGLSIPMLAGGGTGGIIILLLVMFLGGNPLDFLSGTQDSNYQNTTPYVETEREAELADFVSVVLADTETVWSSIFNEYGMEYNEPTLVLFTDYVQSACGGQSAAVGPFYCPGDEKLYIDLSFYDQLEKNFQAPGDFAMAYVVAHEVGHHVQTLLSLNKDLNNARGRVSEKELNELTVRSELQADYLAGVWAHHAESMNLLDEGDLEEALDAANAIGDDTLQKRAQGYVVPDTFTHGTSEQRKRWFHRGFESGDLENGDTFGAGEL